MLLFCHLGRASFVWEQLSYCFQVTFSGYRGTGFGPGTIEFFHSSLFDSPGSVRVSAILALEKVNSALILYNPEPGVVARDQGI